MDKYERDLMKSAASLLQHAGHTVRHPVVDSLLVAVSNWDARNKRQAEKMKKVIEDVHDLAHEPVELPRKYQR